MDSNGSRDERRRQTFPDRDITGWAKAVKPPGFSQRAEPSPASMEEVPRATDDAGVWERVFERDNLFRALVPVERYGGAPGIDGMTVAELRPYLTSGTEVKSGLCSMRRPTSRNRYSGAIYRSLRAG